VEEYGRQIARRIHVVFLGGFGRFFAFNDTERTLNSPIYDDDKISNYM
jgi:hypothetical protein